MAAAIKLTVHSIRTNISGKGASQSRHTSWKDMKTWGDIWFCCLLYRVSHIFTMLQYVISCNCRNSESHSVLLYNRVDCISYIALDVYLQPGGIQRTRVGHSTGMSSWARMPARSWAVIRHASTVTPFNSCSSVGRPIAFSLASSHGAIGQLVSSWSFYHYVNNCRHDNANDDCECYYYTTAPMSQDAFDIRVSSLTCVCVYIEHRSLSVAAHN